MMDTENQQACKNCGYLFTENFCNNCGQRAAHRITVPHVIHDMIHVFLHADKGIFPFMFRLFTQPGTMAREYVEGKRKIFNPYQYLIFCVGFVLFLMVQSHFYEMLEAQNSARAARFPSYFQKAMTDFNYVVKKYANLITFMQLPFIALFAWLFFRKMQHNYAEHFTIIVFAVSLAYTINILILLAYLLFNIQDLVTAWIAILLLVLSIIFIYRQFYNLKLRTAVWKGILIYGASYLVQLLIMGAGLFIYILWLKSRH